MTTPMAQRWQVLRRPILRRRGCTDESVWTFPIIGQGGLAVSAQKYVEPTNQPNPARRALLTGGAVGLAAIAGATLADAQSASAGTSNLTYITPTGNPATDTQAIQNALSNANQIVFLGPAPGDSSGPAFAVNSTIEVGHKASIFGCGALTRINYSGTGACFHWHDLTSGDGSNRAANSCGAIRDLVIDGTNAGSSAYGINMGDGWGYRLDHVFIENFTGTNSIGLYLNNQNYFTEKLVATAVTVRNCTTHVRLTQGSGDNSFEYNDLAF